MPGRERGVRYGGELGPPSFVRRPLMVVTRVAFTARHGALALCLAQQPLRAFLNGVRVRFLGVACA